MKVAQSCPALCNPMDYTVPGVLQARILEWVAFPFSRGSSRPRGRTQVSRTQVGSLLAEPQGKPKNTGVGSLSLLHWIIPTQELNPGSPSLTGKGRVKIQKSWEFPGGPVVRTQGFHGQGPGSIPCQGTKILEALWHGQKTKKKQKKKGKRKRNPKE